MRELANVDLKFYYDILWYDCDNNKNNKRHLFFIF